MDPDPSVSGGWQYSATGSGYTAGDPVYLSFAVPPGLSTLDLDLWHFDGTNWGSFSASDLTCGGGYANFTVTQFSGYAVSAVPEPSAAASLAITAAMLVFARLHRRT